ncbi:MAG: hypothetical protein HY929_03065 [Euryarchaeota archaeon]|nr:hypothetical protein [Euryarchaeota archaeon]
MRFIDRETELKTLSEIEELSKRKLWITAIYARRVGKTRRTILLGKRKEFYGLIAKKSVKKRK